MLFSFLTAKHHYPSALVAQGITPTAAWISRKALTSRNHWHQTTETDFVFDKTGQTFSITDDMSLLQVTHYVIEVEYGQELQEHVGWKRPELLALAHQAADEWCSPPLMEELAMRSGGEVGLSRSCVLSGSALAA